MAQGIENIRLHDAFDMQDRRYDELLQLAEERLTELRHLRHMDEIQQRGLEHKDTFIAELQERNRFLQRVFDVWNAYVQEVVVDLTNTFMRRR